MLTIAEVTPRRKKGDSEKVVNSWRTKKETSRRTVIAMWQNVL
jgi:hypothetical protein